jgi:hypothetical protein
MNLGWVGKSTKLKQFFFSPSPHPRPLPKKGGEWCSIQHKTLIDKFSLNQKRFGGGRGADQPGFNLSQPNLTIINNSYFY